MGFSTISNFLGFQGSKFNLWHPNHLDASILWDLMGPAEPGPRQCLEDDGGVFAHRLGFKFLKPQDVEVGWGAGAMNGQG